MLVPIAMLPLMARLVTAHCHCSPPDDARTETVEAAAIAEEGAVYDAVPERYVRLLPTLFGFSSMPSQLTGDVEPAADALRANGHAGHDVDGCADD